MSRYVSEQFARWVAVGITTNVVFYGIYLLLTYNTLGHKASMVVTYVSSVLVSFTLNRNWSFRHFGRISSSFIRYSLTYAICFAINFFILYIAVDLQGYRHEIVQGGLVLIIAVLIFILQKYWVFAEARVRIEQEK
jgi:putative flippase GtrA